MCSLKKNKIQNFVDNISDVENVTMLKDKGETISEKEVSFDKNSDHPHVNVQENIGKDELENAETEMLAIKEVVNLDGNADKFVSDKVLDKGDLRQRRTQMQSIEKEKISCDGQISETEEKRSVIDLLSGSENSSSIGNKLDKGMSSLQKKISVHEKSSVKEKGCFKKNFFMKGNRHFNCNKVVKERKAAGENNFAIRNKSEKEKGSGFQRFSSSVSSFNDYSDSSEDDGKIFHDEYSQCHSATSPINKSSSLQMQVVSKVCLPKQFCQDPKRKHPTSPSLSSKSTKRYGCTSKFSNNPSVSQQKV